MLGLTLGRLKVIREHGSLRSVLPLNEEHDVDRDPRARTAPGRAGRDGIPARCRRRCTLSAVGTPERVEDLRVEPFATSCMNNGVR